MARPRLNCNGLWARIFGKIVGKSQKSKKIAKNFGKIFQKIAEIFQKIVEIFQKIVEIFQKNCKKFQKNSGKIYKNFLKPLPPTYKSARNPKSFSSRFA